MGMRAEYLMSHCKVSGMMEHYTWDWTLFYSTKLLGGEAIARWMEDLTNDYPIHLMWPNFESGSKKQRENYASAMWTLLTKNGTIRGFTLTPDFAAHARAGGKRTAEQVLRDTMLVASNDGVSSLEKAAAEERERAIVAAKERGGIKLIRDPVGQAVAAIGKSQSTASPNSPKMGIRSVLQRLSPVYGSQRIVDPVEHAAK